MGSIFFLFVFCKNPKKLPFVACCLLATFFSLWLKTICPQVIWISSLCISPTCSVCVSVNYVYISTELRSYQMHDSLSEAAFLVE